jgi:hypothetical protein
MSTKDGNTELMPALDGAGAAALIPERVTEVYTDPGTDLRNPNPEVVPEPRPAIPHPAAPFLGAVMAAPSDFQEWARKWLEVYGAVAEAAVGPGASSSMAAKGRRYARAQGRTVGDTEALELGCWLTAAENLDQVEDAGLRGRPAQQDACARVAAHALAALYVREHGPRP